MARPLLSCVLFGVLAALLPGCSSTAEDEAPPKPPGPFPVMTAHLNGFKSIFAVGDVLIAGQPTPAGLANARDTGVELVINSRPSGEMTFDESAIARGLGMKYVSIPFVPISLQPEQVVSFIRLMKDTTREGKVLLHCSSGNRVSALWAMYEISELDMPVEEAVARARKMGLRSPELIGYIGDFARSIGKMPDL
jgi:uncharacterized protein (TIGR01244 family)